MISYLWENQNIVTSRGVDQKEEGRHEGGQKLTLLSFQSHSSFDTKDEFLANDSL